MYLDTYSLGTLPRHCLKSLQKRTAIFAVLALRFHQTKKTLVQLDYNTAQKEIFAMYTSGEIALIVIGSFAILTLVLRTALVAHATVSYEQESRTENNKLSFSEFAAACCLMFFGFLILTPPILAYSIVVFCLATAAIVPGFLFRACVEPVCGPFACSKTANVVDILDTVSYPCLYVLQYWEVYSMWLVGDEWEEPTLAKAPMPKVEGSEKAIESQSGEPNSK